MPAPQPASDWRGRWLPVLFWTGVVFAPLAALFLLVGEGGGPLRVAAVLAISCVVLIGLSVALRPDADSLRADLEEMILDEADGIREQTREDIVAVARKLHARLREDVVDLSEQVEQLRDQSDRGYAQIPDLAEEAAAFANGMVRRTGTVHMSSEWRAGGVEEPGRDRRPSVGRARPTRPEPSRPAGRTVRVETWSEPERGHTPDHAPTASAAIEPYRPEYQRNGRSAGVASVTGSALPDREPGAGADRHRSDGSGYRADDAPGQSRSHGYEPSGRVGRRRAAEPEDAEPVAGFDVRHRTADPWADLRGDTQPAEVWFGASRHDVGPAGAQQEPGTPDDDWYRSYR